MVKKYVDHNRKYKENSSIGDNGDKNGNEGFSWSEFYKYALPFVGKDKSGFEVDSDAVHSTTGWVNALNSFAYNQTEVWRRNITAAEEGIVNLREKRSTTQRETMWCSLGGYQNTSSNGSRAFGSLCQYGMGWLPFPDRLKNPTVVYDSWLTNGLPRRFFGKDELDVAYTKNGS